MHSKKPTGLKAQLSRLNIFKEWNTNVTRQVEGNTTPLLVLILSELCILMMMMMLMIMIMMKNTA